MSTPWWLIWINIWKILMLSHKPKFEKKSTNLFIRYNQKLVIKVMEFELERRKLDLKSHAQI
jgi:hypothetical protein